jgi:catechol 2,3-dioxygenase-like lactoylglutathione lyase family enzyme
MKHMISLLDDFENKTMNRRQLLQSLTLAATAASAAGLVLPAARAAQGSAGGRSFPVSTINHLSLAATNYAKSRDFYVEVFGMRVAWDDGKKCGLEFGSLAEPNGIFITPLAKPGNAPGVGHFAFGVPSTYIKENKSAMKAEMERRGLQNIRPDGEVGWIADDAAGYMLNPWVPIKDKAMFPGAADPCESATSDKCKAAYEVGLKNLNSIPKPSGKGFKATSYCPIVLNVPERDIPKERDFYSGMLGMKVIFEKLDGPEPEVFLRFGRNTLYLRKTANPGDKPYCNHFGFVVENFNQDAAEARLKALGLDPKPESKLAWTVADPDGMRIEVAGWGLPEHLAKDCKGTSTSCPGGIKG